MSVSMMNQRNLDVLNIMYQTEKPMTSMDIVNQKADLTQSTVMSVLRGMLKKELVEIADVVYSGNVLSRAYRPTPAAKAAILEYFTGLYGYFSSVVSPEELLEAIRLLENNQCHTVTDNRQQDHQDTDQLQETTD